MASEYLHVIVSLLLVIGLMVVMIYLLKKFKLTKYADNKQIKIINIMSIGAKERIILMEVNKTFLLVGATPSHIETLYVFNELEAEQPEKVFMQHLEQAQP